MNYTIDRSRRDQQYTVPSWVADIFGTPRVIESITIHHWGVDGQTHDGVVSWFVDQNPDTSAHAVVSDGRINEIVDPEDAAWAAGNAYGNATSIHIECRPEATDGDYATVAWLVNYYRAKYGTDLPIYAHNHWTSTTCPGRWDINRVDRMARAITTEQETDEMLTASDLRAIALAVWGYRNPDLERSDAYAILRATRDRVLTNPESAASIRAIRDRVTKYLDSKTSEGLALDRDQASALGDLLSALDGKEAPNA